MSQTIKASADLSSGRASVVSRPDKVRILVKDDAGHAVALFLPDEARELAAAILRAADEAEGRKPRAYALVDCHWCGNAGHTWCGPTPEDD